MPANGSSVRHTEQQSDEEEVLREGDDAAGLLRRAQEQRRRVFALDLQQLLQGGERRMQAFTVRPRQREGGTFGDTVAQGKRCNRMHYACHVIARRLKRHTCLLTLLYWSRPRPAGETKNVSICAQVELKTYARHTKQDMERPHVPLRSARPAKEMTIARRWKCGCIALRTLGKLRARLRPYLSAGRQC